MIVYQDRAMASEYMEWVKTLSYVRFNLANSGVKNYPITELPVDFAGLQLSGPGAYGYPPLVEAIAEKCGVSPDCIATATGTSMANHLALAALISPGDAVLIEHPVYSLIPETAQYLGAEVRFFNRPAEKDFQIDLDELSRAVSQDVKLIVLTNLHNPSCAFTCEADLRQVGEMARSVGARVLVDEVYLDVLFENAPPTAYRLGPEFVVTNSLTKVYGLSGLRCGWIVAEPPLIRRVRRLNDLFGVNAPYVTDQISCVALAHLDRIAAWSKNLLATNRSLANEFLAATPQLECKYLEAGTVIFPRLDRAIDDFCENLRTKYETCVTPGRFFEMQNRIRIGIGGETSILQEGLDRLNQALSEA
ncbi:MAG: aminotransferase class I/II-fold pyridoxal phosphate-dependent enzyme [Bryobacteraceae bacterium]